MSRGIKICLHKRLWAADAISPADTLSVICPSVYQSSDYLSVCLSIVYVSDFSPMDKDLSGIARFNIARSRLIMYGGDCSR